MVNHKNIRKEYEIEISFNQFTRKELKDAVINKFLEEEAGYISQGNVHSTNYKYFVEKLKDGRRIYLLRPTFLNKGIDFAVWVEKFKDDIDLRPSHKDIFNDLRLKKKENIKSFHKLLDRIENILKCENPDNVLKTIDFSFNSGFSLELLLKVIKWLFIEQDITYWNYTGRNKLWNAILEELD